MLSKSIVPLDGSQLAEVALPYAEESAGRVGAEIILVTVRQPHDERSQYMLECYLDKIAEMAKTGAAKYQEAGAKPTAVRTKVLYGNPAEEIISFADKEEDSRIIMATHGQSGLTRWALGSVADKVTRATIRPITLIRAAGARPVVHEKGSLAKILAPVDGSKGSEVILPFLEQYAGAYKAEVTFFHVVTFLHVMTIEGYTISRENIEQLKAMIDSRKAYLEKLADSFKKKGIKASYQILESKGDVADEINSYTQANYTDVIVMATHGQSGPRRWVLGSVANKVLREGNTPLTLIRTQE